MSLPLTTSKDIGMRKDLVRLRMEMHRQQLLYNAQPLSHPLQLVRNMVSRRSASSGSSSGKTPLMIATTIGLSLFGRRLGRFGRLAKLALAIYPLVKGGKMLARKH